MPNEKKQPRERWTVSVMQPAEVRGEQTTFFHRAGVAFKNHDGSFNFQLDILPSTKFHMRPAPAAKEGAPDAPGRPQ